MGDQALPIKFRQQNFSYAHDLVHPEGAKMARQSLWIGIAGFFIMGIFLGVLAVVYAHRAEKMGSRALPGKILGYADILIGSIFSLFAIEIFPHLI